MEQQELITNFFMVGTAAPLGFVIGLESLIWESEIPPRHDSRFHYLRPHRGDKDVDQGVATDS